MRRWRAPTTIATRLAAAVLAGLLVPATGAAGDTVARLLAAVAAIEPADLLAAGALSRACGRDARCVAERIVAAGDGRARLVRVRHPDTDWIRWARTRDSISAVGRLADGRLLVALTRFGRTVEAELETALDQADGAGLVVDLRANSGGDFGRMLRVAGRFTGPRDRALYLVDRSGEHPVALAGPARPRLNNLTVLVGPGTASSAEILAALLRRHAGAELVGARTAGKDYLLRVVPVDHDWRLLVPAERVRVPGETLAGGLRADRPAPAAFD